MVTMRLSGSYWTMAPIPIWKISTRTINYPIHLAAMMGHAETVKLLIDAGTDPDEWGAEGKTPYHYDSEEGHQETIRVLIEAGADPNTRSREDFALCRRGYEYDG